MSDMVCNKNEWYGVHKMSYVVNAKDVCCDVNKRWLLWHLQKMSAIVITKEQWYGM